MESVAVHKTWKPTVAGILNIITAVFDFLAILILSLIGMAVVGVIVVPTVIYLIFMGILSLAGGICAIYRTNWLVSLLGSVATFMCNPLFGIFSIIFVSVSKSEFDNS